LESDGSAFERKGDGMIPTTFNYFRPHSIEEALLLLRQGEAAKILAGGQSLIPMMKLRVAEPKTLIDLQGVPELAHVTWAGGHCTVGALTAHATLAADADLRQKAGALWDAANALGDPQVRNLGTIGGACAHADPSADYPAVMLALDACFIVAGEKTREVAAADFFKGTFETALGAGEILTKITFDAAPRSAYVKLEHAASHYALVGVAVVLVMSRGTIEDARIAITGLADVPFRASGVERSLRGVKGNNVAAIRSACAGTAAGQDVRGDIQASSAYRTAMADVIAARAVRVATDPR